MGVSLFGSSSTYDFKPIRYGYRDLAPCEPKQLPKPNPSNFVVGKCETRGDFILMSVKYPDYTNYEGTKLLVHRKSDYEKLSKQTPLNPHFSNNDKPASPIARFVPTNEGWKMARSFAKNYI